MKYSLYAVYTLSTATILLGLFLLIRKISQRSPSFEGDMEFDHERIARELDREIKDLENLRNRIFPASHFSKSSLIVQVPATGSVAQTAPTTSALEASDILKSVDSQLSSMAVGTELPDLSSIGGAGAAPGEVSAAVQAKITELTEALKQSQKEVSALKEKLNASASGAGASVKAEIDTATKDLELKISQQKEEIQKQVTNIKHLEKIISEYQLFEEDFALVKKYRKENEILRGELIKKGLSEADILKMLEAADALTPRTTKPLEITTEASAPAAAPAESASTTPAAAAVAPSAPVAETPAATPAAAAQVAVPEAAPAATASAPAPAPAPALAPTPQESPAAVASEAPQEKVVSAESAEKIQAEAEAMAESVVSEDELMAEFEKLLNEKDQGT